MVLGFFILIIFLDSFLFGYLIFREIEILEKGVYMVREKRNNFILIYIL